MKKINFYISSILFISSLAVMFLLPITGIEASSVMDGFNTTVSEGLLAGGEVDETTLAQAGVVSSIPKIIGKVVGSLLAFLGIAFLLLMIYGGFLWMFSRGNEQEVEKAKNLIQAAIIGLLIIVSAYAITAFVGGALT